MSKNLGAELSAILQPSTLKTVFGATRTVPEKFATIAVAVRNAIAKAEVLTVEPSVEFVAGFVFGALTAATVVDAQSQIADTGGYKPELNAAKFN